jgi:hypothetical protein
MAAGGTQMSGVCGGLSASVIWGRNPLKGTVGAPDRSQDAVHRTGEQRWQSHG